MTPSPIALLGYDLPIILPRAMHKQQQKGRNGKEDAIHDPECKARFAHRAFLVGIQTQGRCITADAIVVDGDGEAAVGGEVGAVCVGNVAKFVDAGNEGADEAEVDEGDEHGGIAGRLAPDYGEDGPGCA